ncbi:MAG: SRPBCC domain-containing protein [Bacteroidetes bacterium]|nr:MAG: SRPBCC domain-containing protein [Bacteroidota bacterium]
MKEKIELEFLLKTSVKVFENLIFTASGLSEWFADDVNIKDDTFSFIWDGSEEEARLISKKNGSHIRWKWSYDEDEEEDYYFEITYNIDPMTRALILKITDFAEDGDEDEVKMFWEASIGELRRVLGA